MGLLAPVSPMRTTLLLGLALLTLAYLPPNALAASDCLVSASSGPATVSCTFSCKVGDLLNVILVKPNNVDGATVVAQCGTQTATCTPTPSTSWPRTGCQASSPGPTLQSSDAGTCTIVVPLPSSALNEAYCYTTSLLSQIPPVAVEVPGTSTPPVDPVSSPGVSQPATCTLAACTAPTVVPGVSTPPIDACLPADVVCVGPVSPIQVLPGTTVPAPCSTPAGAACLPAGPTLVPAGLVTTPAVPAVPLPSFAAYANHTFDDEPVTTDPSPVGPYPVTGPPVPIVVCASTCNVPVTLHGGVVITVTANGSQREVLVLP